MTEGNRLSCRWIQRAAGLVGSLMMLALIGPAAAQANGVPFHTGDVLVSVSGGLIKHFDPSGRLLDTLDTTLGTGLGFNGGGMCFDGTGHLYATEFSAGTVSKFDAKGNLVAANFGSGFNASPESCAFSGVDQLFVGQADSSHQVLKFDTSGNLLSTFSPAPENRGTDWVDLAKDQCTLQYTSEGSAIKQFNVCTNTQRSDFATGLPGPCFAHRLLSDGGVLVACSAVVEHLGSNGSVIKTYSEPTGGSGTLFGLNLDPDGTSFWTADLNTGQIWRIAIATGKVITTFNASSAAGVVPGLAVFGERVQGVQPPAPVLGKTVNVSPVSGVVFIKAPRGKSLRAFGGHFTRTITKGVGFVPLTEARQIPVGSQVDARRGSLKVVSATPNRGKLQSGVFRGGLFKLTQASSRLEKGLTTLSLLEGAFRGAPTYASCRSHAAADGSAPPGQAARLSSRVLQTLHSSGRGRFRTHGRYSAGTVRGTVWDTIDRCDGTLTVVHRGTVLVNDFRKRKTIAVHAGHSYLSKAVARRHK